MGNRISYKDQIDKLIVKIRYQPRVRNALALPVIVLMWTWFGVTAFLSEFMRTGNTWGLVFWLIIETFIIVCFLWNFFSNEIVIVTKDALILKLALWGYGASRKFPLNEISLLIPINYESWDSPIRVDPVGIGISDDDIMFSCGNGIVKFGPRLSINEATEITSIINARIEQYRNNGN